MGRHRKYLNPVELATVDQAVSVAEDILSNQYHLTISSWKRYRYDIRTLKDLHPAEITEEVFAQILRYGRPAPPDGLREGDFYSICLQDHNILSALRRDPGLQLLPLLIYVITHELIHVIRFYKFYQFFDASEAERVEEEMRVHQLTYDALRATKLPDMPLIFDFYARHRQLVD